MLKKINKKAFTLIELVVVIVIVGIISSISFISFTGHISSSRDTVRKSDFAEIFSSMKTYKQEKGRYPIPEETFNLTNNGTGVVIQGKLTKNVGLSTIDEIPLDPKLEIPYLYSVTTNRKEYQIAGTIENYDGENIYSILEGDYKSVSKTVLPSLILAKSSSVDLEIHESIGNGSINRDLFIYSNQSYNLAYDFSGVDTPIVYAIDFDTLQTNAISSNDFSQNSSYETCEEIKDAGKSIGDGDYELRDIDTGVLTTTACTGM